MADHLVTEERVRFSAGMPEAQAVSRAEALRYCQRLAAGHYENFSVLSWLLPARLVPHFAAVYAYCRWADDLADEVRDPSESLRLLDWWQQQLESCCGGGEVRHPVFVALASTIDEFSIPAEPFLRLLDAFRQDQRQTRYETPEDVLAYCQRSANPVGRLVLYLGQCHDEPRGQLADSISTGLQLANFCQDVARDYAIGRIYLPQSTMHQFGCDEQLFARGECNSAFRRMMQCEVERAARYLHGGETLSDAVSRELRLPLALFVGGGLRVLEEIRKLDYDVWRRRPTVSRLSKANLVCRAWWRARRGGSREGSR
jgi:squalene synthase HpnC